MLLRYLFLAGLFCLPTLAFAHDGHTHGTVFVDVVAADRIDDEVVVGLEVRNGGDTVVTVASIGLPDGPVLTDRAIEVPPGQSVSLTGDAALHISADTDHPAAIPDIFSLIVDLGLDGTGVVAVLVGN